MKHFLLYRTYCGGAMSPPVQAASIAAWNDEAHVQDNRTHVQREIQCSSRRCCKQVMDVELPDAGFYLWADVRRTGLSDVDFARRLYAEYNVTVLPGSYLARDAHGINPGPEPHPHGAGGRSRRRPGSGHRIVQFCQCLA